MRAYLFHHRQNDNQSHTPHLVHTHTSRFQPPIFSVGLYNPSSDLSRALQFHHSHSTDYPRLAMAIFPSTIRPRTLFSRRSGTRSRVAADLAPRSRARLARRLSIFLSALIGPPSLMTLLASDFCRPACMGHCQLLCTLYIDLPGGPWTSTDSRRKLSCSSIKNLPQPKRPLSATRSGPSHSKVKPIDNRWPLLRPPQSLLLLGWLPPLVILNLIMRAAHRPIYSPGNQTLQSETDY